jgi:murein DD-endopeptidase MepM/ murein hydrolase activator NlpD
MRNVFTSSKQRLVVRLVLVGLGAGLLAGCADSGRFGDDPLGNPFQTSARTDRNPTGSVDHTPRSSAPAPIQTHPLAAQEPIASYTAPAHPSPKLAAATPPHTDLTGSVSQGQGQAGTGWSAIGGTPMVVAQGETADTIARRYGIPRDAILHTNGFNSASEIRPGTRLVIPVYNASLAASSGPARNERLKFVKGAEPAAKQKHIAANEKQKHFAAKDRPGVKTAQKVMSGHVEKMAQAKPASKPAGSKQAQKQADVKMAMKEPAAKKAGEAMKPAPIKTAKADMPVSEARKTVDQTPTASLPEKNVETASAEAANPEFRWPAHGRIIQGFKAGGNDGINIAVPEGTQVKAVESGVVAYAGSELKGYGNLILIRHPNGFVSAYANNSDIEVKRGDTVKRGQTIAKSGQSGNVASPQLHFELRKGSTPVDPTQYLAGL